MIPNRLADVLRQDGSAVSPPEPRESFWLRFGRSVEFAFHLSVALITCVFALCGAVFVLWLAAGAPAPDRTADRGGPSATAADPATRTDLSRLTEELAALRRDLDRLREPGGRQRRRQQPDQDVRQHDARVFPAVLLQPNPGGGARPMTDDPTLAELFEQFFESCAYHGTLRGLKKLARRAAEGTDDIEDGDPPAVPKPVSAAPPAAPLTAVAHTPAIGAAPAGPTVPAPLPPAESKKPGGSKPKPNPDAGRPGGEGR